MKLWLENRVDQQWEIGDDDLIEKFLAWRGRPGDGGHGALSRQEAIEWRGIEWALRLFIGEPNGLNSVFDRPDFEATLDRIYQRLHDRVYPR